MKVGDGVAEGGKNVLGNFFLLAVNGLGRVTDLYRKEEEQCMEHNYYTRRKAILENLSNKVFKSKTWLLMEKLLDHHYAFLEILICLLHSLNLPHLSNPTHYLWVLRVIEVQNFKHSDVEEGNQVANARELASNELVVFQVDGLEALERRPDYFISVVFIKSGVSYF